MKISDAMTRSVQVAKPSQTIEEAAGMMADLDAGVLPVADSQGLVGMITDRDIAIRAVANGRSPDTTIGEIMTPDVTYCYEDEDIEQVARNMGEIKVRRLPVVNRRKQLVGIVALGDLAAFDTVTDVDKALGAISQPGGPHSQTSLRPSWTRGISFIRSRFASHDR